MATQVGFQLESSLASKHMTDAEYIKGGYIVVETTAERDALPVYDGTTSPVTDGIIVKGSLVYVAGTVNKSYRYNGTSWVEESGPSLGALDTNNSATQPVPTTPESFTSNIDLHKISKTGSYTDLLDKPSDGSATIASESNSIVTLKAGVSQSGLTIGNSSGNDIALAKVAKTGAYGDLSGTPTIPSAPGTLNTNNTASQTVPITAEALSGAINLHKVSKTGKFSDLNEKPSTTVHLYKGDLNTSSLTLITDSNLAEYNSSSIDLAIGDTILGTNGVYGRVTSWDTATHSGNVLYAGDSIDIPTIPSDNITGSGTSGSLTKFNGAHTVTDGPAFGSSTTTFLANDGQWRTPAGTVTLGTLDTNNTDAQTVPTTAESFASNIKLHKVAKTGTYSDLIGTPSIPTKTSDLTNDGDDGTHAFLATDDVVSTYSSSGTSPVNGTAVAAALATLPTPMVFKGTVGDSGALATIAWTTLLSSTTISKVGDTYKVISAHDTTPICKVGDTIICTSGGIGSTTIWAVIPSGDEPSGTVTSVATGSGLTGGPITSSGTISHADTSTQTSSTNSGRTYIQSVGLDDFGHVTSLSTGTETVNGTVTSVAIAATNGSGITIDSGSPITSSGTITLGTSGLEKTSNKVTSLSSSSTDTQYPSAKLLYTTTAPYISYEIAFGVIQFHNFASPFPTTINDLYACEDFATAVKKPIYVEIVLTGFNCQGSLYIDKINGNNALWKILLPQAITTQQGTFLGVQGTLAYVEGDGWMLTNSTLVTPDPPDFSSLSYTASGLSTSKTITALSQTDGVISATASDIAIDSTQATRNSSNDATIASTDVLPIFDTSDSNKLKGSIAFGSTTTTFLANDGTWRTPAGQVTIPPIVHLYKGAISQQASPTTTPINATLFADYDSSTRTDFPVGDYVLGTNGVYGKITSWNDSTHIGAATYVDEIDIPTIDTTLSTSSNNAIANSTVATALGALEDGTNAHYKLSTMTIANNSNSQAITINDIVGSFDCAIGDIVIGQNGNYGHITSWSTDANPHAGTLVYDGTLNDNYVGSTANYAVYTTTNGQLTSAAALPTAITNATIAALPVWSATPTDSTYLIRQDTGGTSSFGRVPFSTVNSYIQTKNPALQYITYDSTEQALKFVFPS